MNEYQCLNDGCGSTNVDVVHDGAETHVSCNDCQYLHLDVDHAGGDRR